jgi:hypothetical protein
VKPATAGTVLIPLLKAISKNSLSSFNHYKKQSSIWTAGILL